MTNVTVETKFKFLLILTSLMPGPIIWLGYKFFWHYSGTRLGLTIYNKDLTMLLATFSFSMLGFLATIITIMIALGDRFHIKTYANNKHMSEFLLLYFTGIGCLICTFIVAIINLGKNAHPLVFDFMIMFFIDSLFQTIIIAVIICNLLKHALKETLND